MGDVGYNRTCHFFWKSNKKYVGGLSCSQVLGLRLQGQAGLVYVEGLDSKDVIQVIELVETGDLYKPRCDF